jgi:predicted dinucleotide-binding enzyme
VFTTVGVIGSGPLGEAIAGHVVAAGLRVLSANTRGRMGLAGFVSKLGPNAFAVTPSVAASADLVILAIPFVRVPELADVVAHGLAAPVPAVQGHPEAGGGGLS